MERDAVSTVRAAVKRCLDRLGPGPYGVACSGGADSLVLADAAIAEAGAANVMVVTIDHGLQRESAKIADAVRTWAEGKGARAIVRQVEIEDRASLEAAARDARYRALEEACDDHGLAWCMLGHTARDQAETVLMRIVRGTGPAGLAGMPDIRGRFVRPLLEISRDVIDRYAEQLTVWDDPMNHDLAFARVRVRDKVMPLLREENPAVDDALIRLARGAAEWREAIDAIAEPFAKLPIDCALLARQPRAVVKRALALVLGTGYESAHLDALAELVMRPSAGTVEAGELERVYGELRRRGSPTPTPMPRCRARRAASRR